MQQDMAAGMAYAYHSAGFAGIGTYFSPPPPQHHHHHHTSSSHDVDVDVDFVHGLLDSGGAADGGNGHRPPCSSSSSPGGGAVMSETRKARRLASNRESARRSRVRRRRQLDELSACTAELRATNQRLVVELNHAEARYAQVGRENARLREEAQRLREKLDAEKTDRAEGDAEDTDEAGGYGEEDAATARTP